jgi:hypothetical protein
VRSLGAIVVGIADYRYDRVQFPPLRYTSKDADEVVKYLTTCWPKSDEAELIRLVEEDATAKAITDAFIKLGKNGPYDLQLIFLSGHGFVDSQRAGFVMQPAAGSSSVLSLLEDASLDRLLASVPAKRTILILDCCYAEGITRRMSFFGTLGQSDARLFIASSREQQLTWEDERIEHGIFTAHLIDLLRTGSSVKLKGVRDQLDVDSELFPVLCDQVPLYVLEHKQQRQEPVKGGISIRAVSLPVARVARRIKERSAFGTAVRRLRQIISMAAMAAIAFLFFAYTLAYYAEADRNGEIRLHHGTKWLAPVLGLLPTSRIDTGISSTDLSVDPANRYSVQVGEISGFWTHVSRQGYRAWYDNIRPSLDPKAAARYDVLLASDPVRPVRLLNGKSQPSEIKLVATFLLDSSDPEQLDILFTHLLGADRTVPLLSVFSPNDLDFEILDRPQTEIASYADALRSTAAIDPDRTFIAYIGFLKACQIWLAHSSAEQHGREAQRRVAEDVADVLAVIAKARLDRGEPALDSKMTTLLKELSERGYGGLVHLALSRAVASPVDKKSAARQALSAFHGNSAEPGEAAAIRQLKDLLDSSASSQAIVEETYRRFVAVGGPEQSDLTSFLIAAADKMALPPNVMAILLGKAKEAVVRLEGDAKDRERASLIGKAQEALNLRRNIKFMDTEYARILAHGMSQVPAPSRPMVYRLIDNVAAGVSPLASSTAEMYTALGRQHMDTPAMFQHIVAEASAAPPYEPANPEAVAEPLPGSSIVVGHGPWLEALAVLGIDRSLAPQTIQVLEKHANDPALRDIIYRALVRQPSWLNQQCWKTSCSQMLKTFPQDGTKRQLASNILAAKLAGLPRIEFLAALDGLRKERASETEPEVRISLGFAIVNSQLARVRTTPIGSRLFE